MTEQEREAAARLIDRYPLAWVVSRDFSASVLPLLAERDADGQIVSIIGHCSRRNPLVEDFARDPAGLILFNGPAGFVSTRYVANPDWAPTWNFAVLRFTADVEFLPDQTEPFVQRLLDHMEGQFPGRWSTDELGDRYGDLLSRIIGFRATVRETKPHFKLGQDEGRATFDDIVANLPDRDLADWMDAFARGEVP